ncbi:MAG: LysM peptidoglycan-binding domain-containing protein [Clostridia bacterium]|nr:LysM peptidoglycan-binding domain-containing protein [Clostridia bacterium]
METILDDLRAAVYQKGETVFCESVGEYTLPDYLPEIRKLLRIETKLLPTGQFMGNGKAEFTGSTVHTLLYSDENGKLSSAVLNGDYRFAVPLTAENEIQIMAESRIDRVSHRLSGPRRIGIRTAIVSDVRFVVDECVSMAQAENSDYSYENLTGRCTVSDLYRIVCEDLHYSDSYRFDAARADAVRPIASDASVFMKDCRPQADGVYCAGEIWVKLLYGIGEGENELTDVLWRKIPFDTVVPFEKALDYAVINGKCTALDASVSDDGLGSCEVLFDLQLALEGEGGVNREVSFVKDMYAHGAACRAEARELSAFRFLGALTQNFSVSGSSAENPVAGARAVDCAVTVLPLTLEREDGKIRAIGEAKAEAILLYPAFEAESARYERAEFLFPIRMELDGKQFSENAQYRCHAEFLGGQLRIDGENLRVDGEVALTLSALEEEKISVLTAVEPIGTDTAANESRECIIVAYPDSGETLWSVAKRYQTDLAALATRNRIPERFIGEPDAPSSIDGVTSIIIA